MQNNTCGKLLIFIIAFVYCEVSVIAGQGGEKLVARTVHNLSTRVTNPKGARNEVCRYCHTPHNNTGRRALWSRPDSKATYKIYESSTLDAKPGQPTGSSKLCLSCHDGTIALSGNGKSMGAGLMNLGTDLSDDHPVSFTYDSALAGKDHQLRNPSALPAKLKLEKKTQLQCTTCHNVHNNEFGNFLAMDDRNGALCTACHQMDGWELSSHRNSTAQVKQLSQSLPYSTVAQNACRNCHRSHNAQGHERLQLHSQEESSCLGCHNGTVAKANIVTEIRKSSAHNPRLYADIHDPVEVGSGSDPHVECADCHNPHAITAQNPADKTSQTIGNTMRHVRGITISGSTIQQATSEYEVCLRCHSETAVPVLGRINRVLTSTNIREEISTTAASYHPIAKGLVGSDTISLKDTITRGSTIKCTDCHNNDNGPNVGGSGPNGPHGSKHAFLLERSYRTLDNTFESEAAYSLCYKCHKRESILANESFPQHKKHIVDSKTPCSVCHDPHGVIAKIGSSQTHLINFNTEVVFSSQSGNVEFKDNGRLKGSCALSCHGKNHEHATDKY